MDIIELLKSAFMGLVEGITEWLPISSTGHMMLLDEFVKLDVSERLEGDVSGASTLHYSGAVKKPALRVSGSSRAEREEK